MTEAAALWGRLCGAISLLAVDPAGLGGLWLRARAGPVRDRATEALEALPLVQRRLHPNISDEQLFGGVDLAATLAGGRVTMRAGLLARSGTLVLPMAERCSPALAGRLAGALDGALDGALAGQSLGGEPEGNQSKGGHAKAGQSAADQSPAGQTAAGAPGAMAPGPGPGRHSAGGPPARAASREAVGIAAKTRHGPTPNAAAAPPAGAAAPAASGMAAAPRHCLIALDEGADDDEALPAALQDRLAFQVDLTGLGWHDTFRPELDPRALAQARAGLAQVRLPEGAARDLAVVAVELGIASLRAPLLALRAARAEAALAGRALVGAEDLTRAVELVLVPRATRLPAPPEEDQAPPDQPPPPDESRPDDGTDDADAQAPLPEIPREVLLEAARALLPPDLLERAAPPKAARGAAGSGAGAARKGNRRGRPLPSRPGKPGGEARVDLVATLRNAAPWQPMRRAASDVQRPLHIRTADIRLRRFEEKSDRLLVFAVDASGSAAFARLAEAKGAVELLLAEAYARRDHVALIAFRNTEAEVLLPPTRSLVQTKRRLAALPGGGGTPLAAGLRSALQLGLQARGRGMSPTVAVLTDGRANIALDGTVDRVRAAEDARQMARALRAAGLAALVIDTGARPEPALRALADAMAAPYLALPRADAGRLSAAVSAALDPV